MFFISFFIVYKIKLSPQKIDFFTYHTTKDLMAILEKKVFLSKWKAKWIYFNQIRSLSVSSTSKSTKLKNSLFLVCCQKEKVIRAMTGNETFILYGLNSLDKFFWWITLDFQFHNFYFEQGYSICKLKVAFPRVFLIGTQRMNYFWFLYL